MGADGYIIDEQTRIVVSVYCYICQGQIELNDVASVLGHVGCMDERGIPIQIEIYNYEER